MSEANNTSVNTENESEDINIDDTITMIDIIVEIGRHYAAQLYAARFAANSEMYDWPNPWLVVRLRGSRAFLPYTSFLHGATNQLRRSADKLRVATADEVIVPIKVQDAIAKAEGFVSEYERCMELIDRKWNNDPIKFMEDRLQWEKQKAGENSEENA